jgi:hypothetical protein
MGTAAPDTTGLLARTIVDQLYEGQPAGERERAWHDHAHAFVAVAHRLTAGDLDVDEVLKAIRKARQPCAGERGGRFMALLPRPARVRNNLPDDDPAAPSAAVSDGGIRR